MYKLIKTSKIALGFIVLYSGYSYSACTQNPSFNNIQVNIPKREYTVQYDDVSAKTLGTISIPYITASSTTTYKAGEGDCGNTYLNGIYVNSWSANANKVAATNIPGIGISVATAGLGGDFDQRLGPSAPGSLGWVIYATSWSVTIKKTGQVTTSGSLRSGMVARLTQTNTSPSSTWYLTALQMPVDAIKINVVSCSVKNTVPTIQLGDWYDTQFPNIGSVSNEVDIPITLSCMAGTNIKATISATSGVVNAAQGQLALSGADKATGVAIQIVDSNKNAIALNTKLTVKDNVAAGDYIFGWKARYIKTASNITPGSANGTATVNIRYE